MFKDVINQAILSKSTFWKILILERENCHVKVEAVNLLNSERKLQLRTVKKTVWIANILKQSFWILSYHRQKLNTLPFSIRRASQGNYVFAKYSVEVILFVSCTCCARCTHAMFLVAPRECPTLCTSESSCSYGKSKSLVKYNFGTSSFVLASQRFVP